MKKFIFIFLLCVCVKSLAQTPPYPVPTYVATNPNQYTVNPLYPINGYIIPTYTNQYLPVQYMPILYSVPVCNPQPYKQPTYFAPIIPVQPSINIQITINNK